MSARERAGRGGPVGAVHRVGLLGLAALVALVGCLVFAAGSAMASAVVGTGSASGVGQTSVTLGGVVDPEGEEVTSCEFEYGTSEAYGQTAPCMPAAPYPGATVEVAVSAEVSALAAGTRYYYRLVAGDSQGLTQGANAIVTTLPAVSELQTEAASKVELSGRTIIATLNGSLAPDGLDTHYHFEYGETQSYGSVSPEVDAGTAFKSEHAETHLTGLKPYTVYHYRLVASNALGTTVGADTTLDTTGLTAPPIVGGLPATNVSQFAATLEATLQTGEALVNYHFEYGTTNAYGSVAPIPDGYTPITSEPVSVSQPLRGLQAGTTYHYRLVASSPGGTNIAGPDETFTTLPILPPTVTTGAAEGVGVGSATLNGTIDPHGWDTTYLFEYGTSTSYGQSWPTVQVDLGALEGAQPVIVNVPGLQPSTTYHYRLVASNGGGTTYGPDGTFTTEEYPAQVVQEPPTLRTLLVPAAGETATPSSGKKAKKKPRKGKKPKQHPKSKHKAHRKKKNKH